jgi:hypothetical protein
MKYFFHMRTGANFVEDIDGVELPDLEAVRREAVLDARSFLAERIRGGDQVEIDRVVEVADETGAVVHTLALAVVFLAALAPVTLPVTANKDA